MGKAHVLQCFVCVPSKAGPMKPYVENLPYDTPEETLRKLFSRHGHVQDIWIANTPCFFLCRTKGRCIGARIAATRRSESEPRSHVLMEAGEESALAAAIGSA